MTKDGSRWWQKIAEPIRSLCYLFFSSPVCLEVKCTWYPILLMTHDPGVSSVVSGFCAFDTCLIIYYIFILMTKFILVTTGKCVFFFRWCCLSGHRTGVHPSMFPVNSWNRFHVQMRCAVESTRLVHVKTIYVSVMLIGLDMLPHKLSNQHLRLVVVHGWIWLDCLGWTGCQLKMSMFLLKRSTLVPFIPYLVPENSPFGKFLIR